MYENFFERCLLYFEGTVITLKKVVNLKLWSPGLWRNVVWKVLIHLSEEPAAYIFSVEDGGASETFVTIDYLYCMNMEAVGSSETLVTTHETTRSYNLKDQKLSFHCRQNLKSLLDNCCNY
jgi:hypothetical protein